MKDRCEVCNAWIVWIVWHFGHAFCSETCATLYFDDVSRESGVEIYCEGV